MSALIISHLSALINSIKHLSQSHRFHRAVSSAACLLFESASRSFTLSLNCSSHLLVKSVSTHLPASKVGHYGFSVNFRIVKTRQK